MFDIYSDGDLAAQLGVVDDGLGQFGRSITEVGDVNGDGFGDFLVGAASTAITDPTDPLGESDTNVGVAVMYSGNPADWPGGANPTGCAAGSCPWILWMSTGRQAFEYLDATGALIDPDDFKGNGNQDPWETGQYGLETTWLPDITGDGLNEWVVCRPIGSGEFQRGVAFIYTLDHTSPTFLCDPGEVGSTTPVPCNDHNPAQPIVAIIGEGTANNFSYYAGPGPDIDGGGRRDLVLAATKYRSPGTTGCFRSQSLPHPEKKDGSSGTPGHDQLVESGRVFVIQMEQFTPQPNTTIVHRADNGGWIFDGSTCDGLGRDVAYPGDVNGDGYGDIVIGAANAGIGLDGLFDPDGDDPNNPLQSVPGYIREGAVYIVSGNPCDASGPVMSFGHQTLGLLGKIEGRELPNVTPIDIGYPAPLGQNTPTDFRRPSLSFGFYVGSNVDPQNAKDLDLNADDLADFIVGAHEWEPHGDLNGDGIIDKLDFDRNYGAAYAFGIDLPPNGAPCSPDGNPCVFTPRLVIESTEELAGLSTINVIGDADGPGGSDIRLAVPAPGANRNIIANDGLTSTRRKDAGAMYLFTITPGSGPLLHCLDTDAEIKILGEGKQDALGRFARIGDVDGDGQDDFVGAAVKYDPSHNTGTRINHGRAYVFTSTTLFGSPGALMAPEDTNNDGIINAIDLMTVIDAVGASGPNPADVNGDGKVDSGDLKRVLARYGSVQ